MSEIELLNCKNLIALVKDPKAVSSCFLTKLLKITNDLSNIKNKNWDNFGSKAVDLYFVSSVINNLISSFNQIDSLSAHKHSELNKLSLAIQNGMFKVDGFYLAICDFEKTIVPEKNALCESFYSMYLSLNAKAGVKLSQSFKDKWASLSISLDNYSSEEFVNEIFENRRKQEEETYFVVDSLAILRSFAKESLQLAKDTSAKFNLPYKYALPLTEKNVDDVLAFCPNREFRKKVHNLFFKIGINKKWNNESSVRKMLNVHYKEANAQGYSSVCNKLVSSDGMTSTDINSFLNSAQSVSYLSYASYLEKLEVFAKEKLGISILRDWDVPFVKREYETNLKENADWVNIKINKDMVWSGVYSLVKRTFNITVEELNEDTVYVNDKVLGFYKSGKLIGTLYVSTEERKKTSLSAFFIEVTNSYFLSKEIVPFAVMSLGLKKGGVFESIVDIEILLHEMGHAIQYFVSRMSPSCLNEDDMPFKCGMEQIMLEFPSQWLEDFAYDCNFLRTILRDGKKVPSEKMLKSYIDYWKFGQESESWKNLCAAKMDWVIHRNRASIYKIDEKSQEIKKEFGLYTSKNDKAFVNFSHFHMKGSFFSYIFTKNLVNIFNDYYQNKTLREKGEILMDWFYRGCNDSVLSNFKNISNVYIFRAKIA